MAVHPQNIQTIIYRKKTFDCKNFVWKSQQHIKDLQLNGLNMQIWISLVMILLGLRKIKKDKACINHKMFLIV